MGVEAALAEAVVDLHPVHLGDVRAGQVQVPLAGAQVEQVPALLGEVPLVEARRI